MTTHLKSAYNNLTKETLDGLINYLKNIGGNSLTVICRRQNAFKTKWTKGELKLRSRCHIQNAVDYLQYIEDKYSERQIKVVIADISKYVHYLDANEDVGFIILSTNTLPSAIHFDTAKRLFYTHQIRDQNQNNYNTDLLAIYALRLALENRIRGLLGIDFAINKGKNVGLASLIKVCKGLKSVKYSDTVNWTVIEWVNDWLNHYMHRHIRPYPWIIHQAIESLKTFIDPKEPLVTESSTIHSFYSATYVESEEELHQEIASALKLERPDIEIAWLSKREVLK
jgi:hypothetical protein